MNISLKNKHQLAFIPSKGKKYEGELIIKDEKGLIKFRTNVIKFNPVSMDLTRHCCNLDLVTGCNVATPGQNCADTGKIEVWM